MAVRASNSRNARRNRIWNEMDDASLAVVLKRKIKDTSIAIRESETPYERSRLKAQKQHYKNMLRKVEAGSYNGDILYHELKAEAALQQEEAFSHNVYANMAGGKAYTNQYGNMDFDFEAAFRKKRYYGVALPIILTLLTLIMIACFVVGILIPSVIPSSVSDKIESVVPININALFVYRIGEQEGDVLDIAVRPDDNGYWTWPKANYDVTPTQGEAYVDEDGNTFTGKSSTEQVVWLYDDLGCTEIYIDAADVIKAWFRTKMLEKTRIDVLENLSVFKGTSYYYEFFLSGTKASELVIKRGENGNFDFGVIYNHIGVYGTIIFLLVTLILSVVMFIQNFVRIFTYTSRKLHWVTFLTFFFGALTFISPAFASCEGTDLGTAFKNYFMALTATGDFLDSTTTSIGVSLFMIIPLGLCFIMLILPKLFRNKHKTLPTHIPKGNKVRV